MGRSARGGIMKKKNKYIVEVYEVWIQPHTVEAENEEEAKDIIRDGGGEIMEDGLEYSRSMDSENWYVTKEKDY